MKRVEVEVYSHASNQAIVRMPGRNFPASSYRGDRLSTLVQDAKEIADELRAGSRPLDTADDLANRLSRLLTHYGQILGEHGIRLPYIPPEACARPSDHAAMSTYRASDHRM